MRKRTRQKEPAAPPPRDYGFLAIVTLAALIAVWLLLMPWVPAIARKTLNRFQLRSSSFVVWAIQFPIPSMYNCANRYEVREIPPGLLDPILDEPKWRYINHFPSRIMTFADGRHMYLGDGRDRWITIESTYRGQTVRSRFHAAPKPDGGYQLNRIAVPKGPQW